MATIKRIDSKTGPSFKITVTQGRDMNGKQVRHYKTWTPEGKMTQRQMQKAVEQAAADFEREIKNGLFLNSRQTVSEYCRYYISLKTRAGIKPRTIAIYNSFLPRIDAAIGHLKISELNAWQLNSFYENLGESGIRNAGHKATAKVDFKAILEKDGLSRKELSQRSGVAYATLSAVFRGKTIILPTAERIAAALNRKPASLFTIEKDVAPLSGKTQLEHHRFLHAVLEQAVKEGLLQFNPADRATPPKAQRHEPDYFQPEEITAILDALEQEPVKLRLFVHLLIVTGCRRGEICGLQWSRVDLDQKQLCINAALAYSPDKGVYLTTTKTSDTRYIKLTDETCALFRKYRAWQNSIRLMVGDRWHDRDFVFTNDEGSPIHPESVSNWLNRFTARHDLPHIHAHAFRHSAASILIANGIDVVTVSRQLGHSNATTTASIYAHQIAEAQTKAAECCADVLLRRKKA